MDEFDIILNKLKHDTQKSNQGKLKIFLGAAAGVGKTYAMLKECQILLEQGIDVVIGYIETHGRKDTESIMPNKIEQLALKEISHNGKMIKEFDLDQALMRHPDIIIVDELAHTNAKGSRNTKRYQDILELLNAGINVYTALNIQHIESINNIIQQITRVEILETVPDSVIENADEVLLIDLPTDDLIERLKEGKIYSLDRVEAALNNFFRKGNLSALRQLALNTTAKKVDQEVIDYRDENNIDSIWGNRDHLVVFVEPSYSSEKIIRDGKSLSEKGFSSWSVVYLDDDKLEAKSMREKDKFWGLLELATKLGARVEKIIGSDPALAIVNYMQENNISTLMIGRGRQTLYYKLFGRSLADEITNLAPNIHINIVTDEVEECSRRSDVDYGSKNRQRFSYKDFAKDIILYTLIFLTISVIFIPAYGKLYNENILMIFLLVTIFLSYRKHVWSALSAALISTACFDVFFVEPRFSVVISNGQYLITFVGITLICVLFSIINERFLQQIKQANQFIAEQNSLFHLGEKFSSAIIKSQIINEIPGYFNKIFDADYALYLPNNDESLAFEGGKSDSAIDFAIVQWVYTNERVAGYKTDTFNSNKFLYVPLIAATRIRGVIVVMPHDIALDYLSVIHQPILHNFVSLLSNTLERIHFSEIAVEMKVQIAINKFSHDNNNQ